MKAIRLFFALSLPNSTQQAIKPVLKSLQQMIPAETVRWTPVQNLHITLQFLQRVEYIHLTQLIEKVRIELETIKPLQLELGDLELLPTANHPRVLSLQVGPPESLASLVRAIGLGIKATNYPVEERPFRGHMTLGRLSKVLSPPSLAELNFAPFSPTLINEIHLFESKPGRSRSLYIPLERFKLES